MEINLSITISENIDSALQNFDKSSGMRIHLGGNGYLSAVLSSIILFLTPPISIIISKKIGSDINPMIVGLIIIAVLLITSLIMMLSFYYRTNKSILQKIRPEFLGVLKSMDELAKYVRSDYALLSEAISDLQKRLRKLLASPHNEQTQKLLLLTMNLICTKEFYHLAKKDSIFIEKLENLKNNLDFGLKVYKL